MRITLGQIEDPVLRFIVTNEDQSRFLPGAKVSMILEDGTPVIAKAADQGGNVAFGRAEVLKALAAVNVAQEPGERLPVIWYTVEAPGYALKDGIVFDPDVSVDEQWKKIYEISLQPAAVASKPVEIHPLVPVAVVAAGLALATYLSPR
jgi:hypothetical protein